MTKGEKLAREVRKLVALSFQLFESGFASTTRTSGIARLKQMSEPGSLICLRKECLLRTMLGKRRNFEILRFAQLLGLLPSPSRA